MANHQTPAKAEEESTARGTGLPLFFQKPAALEKERHAKAGISTQVDLRFAKATNSVMLNAIEFIEAAKYYPIVFTKAETPVALAILGLEQENYFVEADGSWKANAYVPAYVRQYPFILFEQPEDEKFFLCVDEKAPHFRSTGGEGTNDLFNADGTPSAMTSQALEYCSAYYRHNAITKQFVEDLVKHKLLSPYESSMELNSGRKVGISNFLMIDESAVNALSNEVFLEFRKKGWLPFIYLALVSSSNWKQLAQLAEAVERKKSN